MARAIYITTGYFDEELYPVPPVSIEPSANECRHTPVPTLYHAWYEWCELACKTHEQIRCPRCGLWSIWLPKAIAREINKCAEKEERELAKFVKRQMASELRQKARRLTREASRG